MSYRIRDIVLAFIGLILLSPVVVLIILLLACTQKRIFFVQKRPGLHGHPFLMYKFSTLYDVAPGEEEAVLQRERLTPIGKFLRPSSLDELPQLINVLKGEMSLVGPRPLLMEYYPLYSEEQQRRHSVRPGITGCAQVQGRNTISFSRRFEYDCWYVDHQSHLLDLKILAMTCLKVFRHKEVYTNSETTAPKFDGTN